MTDNEIVKALECCQTNDESKCADCPYCDDCIEKNEAIREFVNQHKEIMREFLYNDSTDFMMKWCEYETNTDNLMKEMVGDTDA